MAEPARIAALASGGGSNFQSLVDHFNASEASDASEAPAAHGAPAATEASAAPETSAAAEAIGRIVGVIASREDAGVLERARRAGVAAAVIPTGPTGTPQAGSRGASRGRKTRGILHQPNGAPPDGAPPADGAETRRARGESDSAAEADFLLETLAQWRTEIVVLAGYMKLVPERVVGAYWGRIVNIHPALLPAFGGKGMYGGRVHRAVIDSGVRITGATVHFVDEAYDEGTVICQWPVPVFANDTPSAVAERVLAVEHRLLPSGVQALAEGAVRLGPDRRAHWSREWFGIDAFTGWQE